MKHRLMLHLAASRQVFPLFLEVLKERVIRRE